jgi:glyoxylase-like metal-dependent hydrolase (beta-lactamase superfamily II)
MLWEAHTGPFRVFAIEDGWALLDPLAMFPGSDPLVWAATDLMVDHRIRVSYCCYLVSGPDGYVMVDTGKGPQPGSSTAEAAWGRMPAALLYLGVDPADVVAVIHTHLHPDHIGGNMVDGTAFFPHARWYIHASEMAFWKGAAVVTAAVTPLVSQGRVESLDGPSVILPGIAAIETIGHTPGHISVELTADDDTMLIAGDVTHHPVQVAHPEWHVQADIDLAQAELTRRRLFEALTSSDIVLAASHYPSPHFGRIGMASRERIYVPDTAVRHIRDQEPVDPVEAG